MIERRASNNTDGTSVITCPPYSTNTGEKTINSAADRRRVKRATDVARENPTRNHSERRLGHHRVLENQIRLVRLNIEELVSNLG